MICLLQESNAWVEEIIAKIQAILLSFSEQYRLNALNGNQQAKTQPSSVATDENVNLNFEYFFDFLSESYAWTRASQLPIIPKSEFKTHTSSLGILTSYLLEASKELVLQARFKQK